MYMDASVNLVKQITDKKCLLPFITIIISSRTKMMKQKKCIMTIINQI